MMTKPTNNQEPSISEIDSNQKKYYTTEEAIEFLEPRIGKCSIKIKPVVGNQQQDFFM